MLYQVVEDGEITESYAMPDHDDRHHLTRFGNLEQITTISSDITLDSSYYSVMVYANAGARIVTLPAASLHNKRIYIIKKTDPSANTVTIDGNGAETIDGAATQILLTQYESITIQSNGTAWFSLTESHNLKKIQTISSNITLDSNYYTVLVYANAGARIITLPAASLHNRRIYIIKKTDPSANTVTIDGNGAETIDGAATQSLGVQWDSYTIQSNGTAWFIL